MPWTTRFIVISPLSTLISFNNSCFDHRFHGTSVNKDTKGSCHGVRIFRVSVRGGGGKQSTKFYTGRLRLEVQPVTPFIYNLFYIFHWQIVRHLHITSTKTHLVCPPPPTPVKVLHKHCFQFLSAVLVPRRNENQKLCKILRGIQGVLWEMCKWKSWKFFPTVRALTSLGLATRPSCPNMGESVKCRIECLQTFIEWTLSHIMEWILVKLSNECCGILLNKYRSELWN